MENAKQNRIQISLGDVVLEAPETPDYLNIVAQIIKMRQAQFDNQLYSDTSVQQSKNYVEPNSVEIVNNLQESSIEESDKNQYANQETTSIYKTNDDTQSNNQQANLASPKSPVVKRGRWFQTQFPLVTIEDGMQTTLKSLDELREILIARGLQPHPRGDASMLLWQVRNRLGFHVEAISSYD